MNVAALELLVPGTIGLLLSAAFARSCHRTLQLARASRDWPTAPGRVVANSTRTVRQSHTHPGVRVDVSYEYEVGGVCHQGTRVRFAGTRNLGKDDAERTARRYPVGSRVVVHHHPAQPELATLETTVPRRTRVLLAVATLVALGIVAGLGATLAG